MIDREKVIKGLEYCTQYGCMCGLDCNGHWGWADDSHTDMELLNEYRTKCPYGNCETGCVKTLARDAFALLKAQEPRVMTLEEAASADCVWYEWRTIGVRPAKVIPVPSKTGTYRIQRFGDIDEWNHADEYDEYWRCWTSRPTDEQREGIPWQE